MKSPLEKLREQIDRQRNEINFMRQMIAGLEARMNSLARFENLNHAAGSITGTSKSLQLTIPPESGAGIDELVTNDDKTTGRDALPFTGITPPTTETFVRSKQPALVPEDTKHSHLSNVLIATDTGLKIYDQAKFIDMTYPDNNAAMKITYATVNLGDPIGAKKYALPVAAWC